MKREHLSIASTDFLATKSIALTFISGVGSAGSRVVNLLLLVQLS